MVRKKKVQLSTKKVFEGELLCARMLKEAVAASQYPTIPAEGYDVSPHALEPSVSNRRAASTPVVATRQQSDEPASAVITQTTTAGEESVEISLLTAVANRILSGLSEPSVRGIKNDKACEESTIVTTDDFDSAHEIQSIIRPPDNSKLGPLQRITLAGLLKDDPAAVKRSLDKLDLLLTDNNGEFEKMSGYHTLLMILQQRYYDPEIQAIGLQVLSHHLEDADPTTGESVRLANGFETVLLAMQNFPDDVKVQRSGCAVVGELVLYQQGAEYFVETAKGLPTIIAAMKAFPDDAAVQKHGCAVFNKMIVEEWRLLPAAFNALPVDDYEVQETGGCGVFNQFNSDEWGETLKIAMRRAGALGVLAAAAERHRDNKSIHSSARSSLKALV